ncbi:MAG: hypothetical protein PUB87_05105 [Eubacteriaceae bacterium]|nr:hypothetical protein [Eubacteriaceae bacterium]
MFRTNSFNNATMCTCRMLFSRACNNGRLHSSSFDALMHDV